MRTIASDQEQQLSGFGGGRATIRSNHVQQSNLRNLRRPHLRWTNCESACARDSSTALEWVYSGTSLPCKFSHRLLSPWHQDTLQAAGATSEGQAIIAREVDRFVQLAKARKILVRHLRDLLDLQVWRECPTEVPPCRKMMWKTCKPALERSSCMSLPSKIHLFCLIGQESRGKHI